MMAGFFFASCASALTASGTSGWHSQSTTGNASVADPCARSILQTSSGSALEVDAGSPRLSGLLSSMGA